MADGGVQPDPERRALDGRLLRNAFGRFATGVTVVTAADPSGPMGFVANSFSSLSLTPPLVLWSLARTSARFAKFAAAEHYAIHVLGLEQADWMSRFARNGSGFDGLDWQPNAEGAPTLPGVLARFDCRRHASHDGGDHLNIVGEVLHLDLREGEPLIFSQGTFGGFRA